MGPSKKPNSSENTKDTIIQLIKDSLKSKANYAIISKYEINHMHTSKNQFSQWILDSENKIGRNRHIHHEIDEKAYKATASLLISCPPDESQNWVHIIATEKPNLLLQWLKRHIHTAPNQVLEILAFPNGEQQTAFHILAQEQPEKLIDTILQCQQQQPEIMTLLTLKDSIDDTPLHLLADYTPKKFLELIRLSTNHFEIFQTLEEKNQDFEQTPSQTPIEILMQEMSKLGLHDLSNIAIEINLLKKSASKQKDFHQNDSAQKPPLVSQVAKECNLRSESSFFSRHQSTNKSETTKTDEQEFGEEKKEDPPIDYKPS
ncbi:hypothetical protein N9Y17_04355 [Gammaproteobacteria bacterium]|nr:hypothetical protein [Gammaproteobacteria bacterium]